MATEEQICGGGGFLGGGLGAGGKFRSSNLNFL